MRKITDFVVNKRYFILIIFIILSILSIFISKNVNINHEMSEYLPNTSETKIGMKIMEKNFDEIKESDLNVMFKNLSNDEFEKIKSDFENIKNVTEVTTDKSKNYTLFSLKVNDFKDSKYAKSLYNDIKEKYQDYEVYYSGSINNSNEDVLPMWIVVLAVSSAFIILIIMCESYIEPFLILFSIILAVFLNKGTNIIFPNISNVTDSICAILQMALSIDYSIMLINRYSQEREKIKNKEEAMKNALYNAFKSISSSSVTTIVGLLALIFMSFTIGRDLGLVLAKGVLLSLLSIFLCLPGLLIIFDSLITKLKKKTFNVNMDFFGKFSHKFRYPLSFIFVVIFVIAFLLKGSLDVSFTSNDNNDVQKIFEETNKIAIVYNNKYEDKIATFCQDLSDSQLKDILCYGNTLNEELAYDELKTKLSDLGNDTNIDDYLIKIIYYYYFNKDNNLKITYNDFIKFIENEIYKNDTLNSKINKDIKNNMNKLKNFTNKDLINKSRTSSDISKTLSINSDMVDNIFLLNHTNNINVKINIPSFVKFLNNNVISDKNYGSSFNSEQKKLLKDLDKFTNINFINTELNSKELENIFDINSESIDSLNLLYNLNRENDSKLTISDFIINVSNIKNNTNYLNDYDLSSLLSLVTIAKNENNINGTKLNKAYLSTYFQNISPSLVDLVYANASLNENYTMSPFEFITFTLTNFDNVLDNNTKNNLKLLNMIIEDTLNEQKIPYSVSEMSNILNINAETTNKLYNLNDFVSGYQELFTPYTFVKFLIDNQDNPSIASSLNSSKKNTLNMLFNIMNNVIANKNYTFKQMAGILNISEDNTKLLYSLYDIKINKYNANMSLSDFINYILNDVINNPDYKNKFSKESINKLKTLTNVMTTSLNNEALSLDKSYKNLSKLSNDLDKNLMKLIYIYYGSINDYDDNYKLTVENFINYLNSDILSDDTFKDQIDNETRNNIINAKKTVVDAKDLLKSKNYSRIVLNTTYNLENDESFKFVKNLRNNLKNIGDDIYVIGDTPMAYDMSESFNSEMNLITILTMAFIFIVVAITFKSLIIPLILVLVIQCAVFLTMGIITMSHESVYFIALLIVQSILMGATIDYAIVYTSYYLETRKQLSIIDSIKFSYTNSIHTILTSSSILIIVTLIVGYFSSNITSKICITLSKGTLCSSILILCLLPALLATFDKFIIKQPKN